MCGLPGELPVEKGTTVDGTPCGVSGICIEGTCVVSSYFLSFSQSNSLHQMLLQPMGCDGLIGSIRSTDKCGRCGVTEGPCLHVPCNIKKGDGQENGMYVFITNSITKLMHFSSEFIVHNVMLPAESSHIKLLLKSSACKFLGDITVLLQASICIYSNNIDK